MKRGFLKGGLDKPSSQSSTAQTIASKTQGELPVVQPKSGLATGTAGTLHHPRRDPTVTHPSQRASRQGFGGSDGSADTVFITNGRTGPGIRLKLLEHPQYFKSLTDEFAAFSVANFSIVPIAGKGLGMIAKRDISSGDTILRERPLLVGPEPLPYGLKLRSIMEDEMSPARRHLYWDLHNCKPPVTEEYINAVNIMLTNGMLVLLPFEADTHVAAFDMLSRVNHSCTPNAEYLFDYELFCGELQAVTPIKAGDEIFIPYIDVLPSSQKRNALLRERYGFACDCDACNRESSSFAKSEARRKVITNLCPAPVASEAALRRTNYDDAYIDRVLHLLEEEGLAPVKPHILLSFALFEKGKAEELSHGYARAIVIAKRGLTEAKRLGYKGKNAEWFQLKKTLDFCEAEKHPGRVKATPSAKDGRDTVDVNELLEQLEAMNLPEYEELKQNLKTPEQIALFKAMISGSLQTDDQRLHSKQ